MAECTASVKAFAFCDGRWTHFRVKVRTLLSEIASFACFGAIVHEFSAPFGMVEGATIPSHAKLACVVNVLLAGFQLCCLVRRYFCDDHLWVQTNLLLLGFIVVGNMGDGLNVIYVVACRGCRRQERC